VNEHDTYVMLALRFGWTPQQVDELPADYYDNLLAALQAEAMNRRMEAQRASLGV
jgi:hypothetical protein